MHSLQELKLIMDSVGPQTVGKRVLATKSDSKENKKQQQKPLKQPKKSYHQTNAVPLGQDMNM